MYNNCQRQRYRVEIHTLIQYATLRQLLHHHLASLSLLFIVDLRSDLLHLRSHLVQHVPNQRCRQSMPIRVVLDLKRTLYGTTLILQPIFLYFIRWVYAIALPSLCMYTSLDVNTWQRMIARGYTVRILSRALQLSTVNNRSSHGKSKWMYVTSSSSSADKLMLNSGNC